MAQKQNFSAAGLKLLAVSRISLGLIFLWAFADKLFGLGFSTCKDTMSGTVSVLCERAWLQGGSPTSGFLKNATQGPFESIFQNLAGNSFVDVLFMAGLLLIGVALVFGIGMKLAAYGGVLLMLMMYAAALPPENHPFIDDHIIYALLLMVLLAFNSQQEWGLRKWWIKQSLVKRLPILE